jgi:peptidoglycan/xylan/chitin deacetylase (PgdA/CDA1 family)
MLKRFIKLGASLLLFILDWLRAQVCSLVGRQRTTCIILDYHPLPAGQRESFTRQMDVLVRLAKPIPADYRGQLDRGMRYVAVTFDDGCVSVSENALPVLNERRIPATIFMPTGSLGRRPSWLPDGPLVGECESVLSAEQLKALLPNDLVTIGSHTVTHPNLLKVDEDQARHEFRQSKADLEEILGRKVDVFSFPHGAYNTRLLELAKEAGYSRVFTIDPIRAMRTPEEFVSGRVTTSTTDWPLEFRLKLLGAYRWFGPVGKLKRRIFKLFSE